MARHRYGEDIIPAVEGTPAQEAEADEVAASAIDAVLCECGLHFWQPFVRSFRVNGTHGGGRQLFVRKFQCRRCERLRVVAVEVLSSRPGRLPTVPAACPIHPCG